MNPLRNRHACASPSPVRQYRHTMNSLEELISHFTRFPGIGPRQARRFAMHLLTEDDASNEALASLIKNLRTSVTPCVRCQRFVSHRTRDDLCSICANGNRETGKLMIVERDSDVTAIERANAYSGRYFVFGGTIPLLASDEHTPKKVRGGALKHLVATELETINEIILAFAANPDGDNTARYVESLLKESIEAKPSLTITHLGRGLSTGSELEYADPDTITFALQNRR